MKSLKSSKKLANFSLFFFLFLVGCGYRWQPEYPQGTRPSLFIPLISGDEDGNLGSEIIRTLNESGLVEVCRSKGDYRLQVAIQSGDVKTIGFRRDVELIKGKYTKNLIASEARKSVVLEVSLYEGKTDRIVYGPYLITSDAEFDYVMGDAIQDLTFSTPADPLVVVLPFSLGQLESNESAQEAATKPLYARLAQKIVDVIASEW